jgi:hypothetical protein
MTRNVLYLVFLAPLVACGGRPVEVDQTGDGALPDRAGVERRDGPVTKVTPPPPPPAVTERVTCIFKGSTTTQSCSSIKGKCSGVKSCTAVVTAPSGKPLSWSSTCSGIATSITDGQNESVSFVCPPHPPPMGNLTCVFMESTSGQKCYTATSGGDPLASSCSGVQSCAMNFSAVGVEMVFKSSCGGYAYALLDGKAKTVGFYCGQGGNIQEKVTCHFKGSTVKRTCTSSGLPGPFRCTGMGSCVVDVTGKSGTKLSWSSSGCTTKDSTTIDKSPESVYFTCK